MAGIYIHIPFCKQACIYCDFYFSTQLSSKNQVVAALLKEIDLRHTYLHTKKLSSIYLGGGTPSLLSDEELLSILNKLATYFTWGKDVEITLEANPDDITRAALKRWKSFGINRLSIGLQSFNDDELKWMNRAHTAAESVNSVKLAQDAGFHNLTIDLIYGSKFQTISSWEKTLSQAVDLNTPHISSYNLTIENKTVLGLKQGKGQEPPVSDELSSRQFVVMTNMLSLSGFEHYEISNFAKAGFYARHNSNYWLQKHYLGLGPSAHSFNGVSRQWNVKNNTLYSKAVMEGKLFFEKEELSTNDRYNEYILTSLRTIWGCDTEHIRAEFGENLEIHFKERVHQKLQFFDVKNTSYVLTPSARLIADGLAADLFI